MNDDVEQRIRVVSLELVKLIQDRISYVPVTTGKKIISYKIPIKSFYETLKKQHEWFDEIEWVKVLKFLKETRRLRVFYHALLDIPIEYDGHSSIFYPEAYDGDGRVRVKILREIKNPSCFYPDCDGIENHDWSPGKIIYLPAGEMTEAYKKMNYIEELEP